ncbi:MAG: fibro-slime domain-containing protein [Fibromonadales bacterium]|nr:fibro-slime domain-containing protein [Fibromonadales bacterium]
MKPFHKLTLTFFMLALFAVNAAAQTCGGKTVYLQLPTSGNWSQTTIYLYGQGSITQVPATRQGSYSVFTMPNLQNDTQNNPRTFSFSMKGSDLDAGNRWIASGNRYDITGARPSDAQGISCGDFTSSTIYIYPNPNNTSQTLVSAQPPNAYNFYFLPPSDPEWTLGTPFIVWVDNGTLKSEKFSFDSRCGWFKKTWFNTTPPNAATLIFLNNPPNDQLGLLGLEEDPGEWVGGNPTPFNLVDQFSSIVGGPGDLFFIPSGGAPVWGKTDQGRSGVCSYGFAAIIYDTDASVNTSFFDFDGTANGSGSPKDGSGILRGIVQPVLKDGKIQWKGTSTSTTSFNGANDGWNKDNFEAAFDPKSSKNVVRCYDMPFKRNSEGLWEFDSNKLCADGSMDLGGTCASATPSRRFLGGFFPPELQTNGDGDYSVCPNCNKSRPAQGWVDFNIKDGASTISKWCYDRGYLGPASVTGNGLTSDQAGNVCTRRFTDGDFRNGDNPPDFWDWEGAANDGLTLRRDGRVNGVNGSSVLNQGPVGASGTTTINGDGWSNKTMSKNELFCFESTPAELTYEPGQEFFFSGDDDIWIYISNYLVIDLGGTHLAAPGYVNLDTLRIPAEARVNGKQYASDGKLVEGETYPMNIFFCDRRTTMSNVRITTNMFFAQKNLLTVQGNASGDANGAKVCIESSGSSGTCKDVMGGGNSNASGCGEDLGNILDYYMLNRRGDQMNLSPSNSSCSRSGDNLVCYGGVTLLNYYSGTVGAVAGVRTRAPYFGLMGSYKVYAKIKDERADQYPNATPVLVATFTAGAMTFPVWGSIAGDDGKHIYNLGPQIKSTVSGKLVPIGFAAGSWTCEDPARYGQNGCTFEVFLAPASEGGSYGQLVNISSVVTPGASRSGLRFFTDSLGNNEVQAAQTFEIPGASGGPFPGLLVLWVTGAYEAAEDETYTINNEHQVTVYLPRLGFINPADAGSPNPTQLNYNSQTKGSDPSLGGTARQMAVMIGTPLDRAIAAYDISVSPKALCTTCNFPLTLNAWTTTPAGAITTLPSSGILRTTSDIELKDGIAEFTIIGARPVNPDSFAHFEIKSLSSKQETWAKWDSLLFEQPPIPFPQFVKIFDRNGDGIGDSLSVEYDRVLHQDSLPSMIEVIWETDTLLFGLGQKKPNGEYEYSGGAQNNRTYWTGDHVDYKLKTQGNLIEIYDMDFSKNIKTQVGTTHTGLTSWATAINNKGIVTNFNLVAAIEDKIPAIVIKASYKADEVNKDCGTSSLKCRDEITLVLSEPVKGAAGISDVAAKTAFAYMLKESRDYNDFNVYQEDKNLPVRISWAKSGLVNVPPENAKGDSIVYLTYNRQQDQSDTTSTPMAGDSVKFTSELFGYFALTDLAGNSPNPREIGRRFEGTNPFKVDDVRLAEVEPDKNVLEVALIDRGFTEEQIKGMYNKDKQVTILPTPGNWTRDSISKYYPGSIGQLFQPDVSNIIGNIQESEGGIVSLDSITFYAKAYYHTNLGSFVVEGPALSVKCSDPIFNGNCTNNDSKGVYMAWNLKDSKNRWVGAGAYVEVYDFRWEIRHLGKTRTYNSSKKQIEMMGVKRAKKQK